MTDLFIVTLQPDAPFGCLADMPKGVARLFQVDHIETGADQICVFMALQSAEVTADQLAYLDQSLFVTYYQKLEIAPPYDPAKVTAALGVKV